MKRKLWYDWWTNSCQSVEICCYWQISIMHKYPSKSRWIHCRNKSFSKICQQHDIFNIDDMMTWHFGMFGLQRPPNDAANKNDEVSRWEKQKQQHTSQLSLPQDRKSTGNNRNIYIYTLRLHIYIYIHTTYTYIYIYTTYTYIYICTHTHVLTCFDKAFMLVQGEAKSMVRFTSLHMIVNLSRIQIHASTFNNWLTGWLTTKAWVTWGTCRCCKNLRCPTPWRCHHLAESSSEGECVFVLHPRH